MINNYSYEIHRGQDPTSICTIGLILMKNGEPIEGVWLDTWEEAATWGQEWVEGNQDDDIEEAERRAEYRELSALRAEFFRVSNKIIDEL